MSYVLIDDGAAAAAAAALSSLFGEMVCGTPWTGCWVDPRAGVDAVLFLAGASQRLSTVLTDGAMSLREWKEIVAYIFKGGKSM